MRELIMLLLLVVFVFPLDLSLFCYTNGLGDGNAVPQRKLPAELLTLKNIGLTLAIVQLSQDLIRNVNQISLRG